MFIAFLGSISQAGGQEFFYFNVLSNPRVIEDSLTKAIIGVNVSLSKYEE